LTSRERQYLLDILVAAEDAVSFVGIAEGTESEVPDLPWRRMKNLRNVIIHDYEGVNLPLVWEIVNSELPPLIGALAPLFPERPQ